MVTLHAPQPVLAREPGASLVDRVLAHFRRGNKHFDDGDFRLALEEFQAALALVPDDATLLNNLGVVLSSLGRHDEALSTYDRLLALSSADAAAWHNLGVTLAQLNRYEEAVAAYTRALEMAPDTGTLANRALAEAHAGRLTDALHDLDSALSQRAGDTELLSCRRTVLEEMLRSLTGQGVLSWAGGKAEWQ